MPAGRVLGVGSKELQILNVAGGIYKGKGFEYFNPEHALRGYSQFPSLSALDAVALKLLSAWKASAAR